MEELGIFEPTRCHNLDDQNHNYYHSENLKSQLTWHSEIPLIQLAQDQTGAELSNIPDYQMVPMLT